MSFPIARGDAAALNRIAQRKTWLPASLAALAGNGAALAAALLLIVIVLCALAAPWIAPHDPGTIGNLVLENHLKPPAFLDGGRLDFLLGTDVMGNDVLSRLIYASRVSLLVGFAAVAIAGSIGVVLGLIAGYLGGWFDHLIMGLADAQLAVPAMLLAVFLMAILGAGLWNVVIVLALASWVSYARVVRGQVLATRSLEYVEAARTVGVPELRIMFRHILPNCLAPVIIIASFSVANAIMSEAALSFLGLGVGVDIPTWGSMLADGRDYLIDAWWLAAFPGLAIMVTVLGINVLGDWLRDYLDPRLRI